MSQPAFAIQIVTYNSCSTILACLASVAAQDVSHDVILIDQASTDGTPDLLETHGYTVHRNPTNPGYSAGHNQAIRLSNAPLILTLNPDVVLQPGFLRAMQEMFASHPTVGMANGCLLRVETINGAPICIDSLGVFIRRTRRQGLRGEGQPISAVPGEITPIFGPDGAAAVYRRAMLEDIALDGEIFDEDFFLHKEDLDVCWRGRWRGWQAVCVPQAVAHHIRTFRPGQRESMDAWIKALAVRNRYWLMLKNDVPAWSDWPAILLYDAALIVYCLLFERSSLRGLWQAWQGRGQMWAKRQQIMAGRRITPKQMRSFFDL
jgi:GT2 family glycosyltransferase